MTSGSSTPIDTNASYYLASNLGNTVNPDFKGGTLRVDTTMVTSAAFTVEAYAGNAIDSYGHTGLFSGVLSGAGGLTIKDTVGGGKVVLTGANTYTGGTTVASGGTLQIGAGGTTGSIAGNIANDGTLVFNRSNSVTYGGAISGTGTVSVTGGGTVVLTGANTYTGLTTIAAGSTLQIGNGGTTGSIVSNVVNQGVLAFNRSDDVTFNGTVTGDGTLVQNGTGKVIVTTNYTGKTFVNSGTLQIGNGATSGTVSGDIVNSGSVIYGQAAATTYTGVISGTGGLSVSGGGVVVLDGANTYSGPTTVTSGSLIIGDVSHPSAGVASGVTVGNNAIVGGYGTIGGNLVASGGVVSPGGSIGTLTVNGNYTQSSSSTLSIEVAPSASDKLIVNGAAHLGGTLAVSLAPGSYGARTFAFLTAGSVDGTFATVTLSGAAGDMVYSIVYAPKEVDLAMAPMSSGQIYGDIVTQSLDTAAMLNRVTLERLDGSAHAGWSVWSKTLSGAGRTHGDEGLAEFNTQLWGVISGADYRFGDGTKLSGVFSYTHDQLGVHGINDKASTDGYFFALGGHIPADAIVVDITGFLQHNEIGVARSSGNGGKTSNLVAGASAGIGYPLQGGDIVPFARLTIASVDTGAFTETGTLGLAMAGVQRTSVRSSWGIAVNHDFTTEDGTQIAPRLLIGVENEFGQSRRDTPMNFAGTGFVAPAPSPSDLSVLLGAGLSAKLDRQLDLSLESTGRLSANHVEGIVSFGAKFRF